MIVYLLLKRWEVVATNTSDKPGVIVPQDLALKLPEGGLVLEKGGVLKEINVRYECFGALNAERSNVVFICHALTGDAHVTGFRPGENPVTDRPSGWWEGMVGPLCGIDTTHYHVICANILGGCKGTTGPSSINPDTGEPYGMSFPEISMGDTVTVNHLFLHQLGFTKLAAVVGGSFGGMQVLDWAIRYPDDMERCVVIASADRLNTQALAFDIVGRHAITQDPNWNHGNYYHGAHPDQGLANARKLAHITYLSQTSLDDKFGREKREEWVNSGKDFHVRVARDFRSYYEIESYLEYQGQKFVKRFDANSYLHITRVLDAFDLTEMYGSLENAIRKIKAKTFVVSLSGDWLFTREQAQRLVKAFVAEQKEVSYCHLDAPAGHDAFLTHIDELKLVVRAFLTATRVDDVTSLSVDPMRDYRDFIRQIPDGARVLDLGCNDGALLKQIAISKHASCTGIEIDLSSVIKSLHSGLNVIMEDIDSSIPIIPDETFDVAIISHTIQVLRHPDQIMKQLLRVAEQSLVAFPNFAYLPIRLYLFFSGRMPKAKALPYEWFDTPNIHLCTLRDFLAFCKLAEIHPEIIACHASSIIGKVLLFFGWRNLGADRVIVRLTKA